MINKTNNYNKSLVFYFNDNHKVKLLVYKANKHLGMYYINYERFPHKMKYKENKREKIHKKRAKMSNCEGTEEKINTKIITIKPAFKNNLTSL